MMDTLTQGGNCEDQTKDYIHGTLYGVEQFPPKLHVYMSL